MMYMYGYGPCFACGKDFMFNVDKVPSFPVKGIRRPICAECIERINPKRIGNGLEPVIPLPGAYEPEEVD